MVFSTINNWSFIQLPQATYGATSREIKQTEKKIDKVQKDFEKQARDWMKRARKESEGTFDKITEGSKRAFEDIGSRIERLAKEAKDKLGLK